jgi:uncharacterized protein (TIGR02466 family)
MSDYQIDNIYPTPIFSSNVSHFEEIQEEIAGVIGRVEFKTIQSWGNPHHLSTTTFNEDLIDKHQLAKTLLMIDANLRNYCSVLGFPMRDYHRESWLSLFKHKEYSQTHCHNTADISGVYYFQTSGKDGDFFFESPVTSVHSSLCFGESCGLRIPVTPKEGLLLMFPSWLNHGVMPNRTQEERISLSFNIYFKR